MAKKKPDDELIDIPTVDDSAMETVTEPDEDFGDPVSETGEPEAKAAPSPKPRGASPLERRGKSTQGNKLFIIVMVVVVLGIVVGVGYGPYSMSSSCETMALDPATADKDDVAAAMEYLKDPKVYQEFKGRMGTYLGHSKTTFQTFAARVLTHVALQSDGAERQDVVGRFKTKLETRGAHETVKAEIIRDLAKLALVDDASGARSLLVSAVAIPWVEGVGFKRDTRGQALNELGRLPGMSVEQDLCALVESLEKQGDSEALDLRFKAVSILASRFIASTQANAEPHQKQGEAWEHDVKVLGCLLSVFLSDSKDARARLVSQQTLDALHSPRGMELWVHCLKDKNVLIRLEGLSHLRRVSNLTMPLYDPFSEDPSAGVEAWQAWASAYKG
ncbi:MAG: hypothetical protein AB7F75_07985 [Planctomycetota bacterium]